MKKIKTRSTCTEENGTGRTKLKRIEAAMNNIVSLIKHRLFKKSGIRVGIMYPLKDGLITVGDKIYKLPKGWILKRVSLDNYDVSVEVEAKRRRYKADYEKHKELRRLQHRMSSRRQRIRQKILILESELKQSELQPDLFGETEEIKKKKLMLSDLQNELMSILPKKKGDDFTR